MTLPREVSSSTLQESYSSTTTAVSTNPNARRIVFRTISYKMRVLRWFGVVWMLVVFEQLIIIHHQTWIMTTSSNHDELQSLPNMSNFMAISLAASMSSSLTLYTGRRETVSSHRLHQPSNKRHNTVGLHVVISYCDKSLDWIWKQLQETQTADTSSMYSSNIKSITIYSKCHQTPNIQKAESLISSSSFSSVKIITLPNVGRCDHSYAYWIATLLGQHQHIPLDQQRQRNNTSLRNVTMLPQDAVWFVKDNDNAYRSNVLEDPVPFDEMQRLVHFGSVHSNGTDHYNDQKGFACASRLKPTLGSNILGPTMPTARHTVAINVVSKKNIGRFRMYSLYQRDDASYTIGDKQHQGQDIDDFEDDSDRDGSDTGVTTENDSPQGSHRAQTPEELIFPSKYEAMEDWVDELPIYNITLGNRLVASQTIEMLLANQNDKDQSLTNNDNDQISDLFMPVCYGGQFMTTIERIQNAPVTDWSAIVKSLSRGDNIEEGHFMERMWAVILSPPMSEMRHRLIHEQGYIIMRRRGPIRGLVLLRPKRYENIQNDNPNEQEISRLENPYEDLLEVSRTCSQGLHVVVSHCDKPMDWLWDNILLLRGDPELSPASVKSITILSRCNQPPRLENLPRIPFSKQTKPQVWTLPNDTAWQDDYSYAYWIAKMNGNTSHVDESMNSYHFLPEDHVLFVRDSDSPRAPGSRRHISRFRKTMEQSLEYGFSCGNHIPWSFSGYVRKSFIPLNLAATKIILKDDWYGLTLQQWIQNLSKGLNKTFLETIVNEHKNSGIEENELDSFMPICFGRYFMATIENIRHSPVTDWNIILNSLSKNDRDDTGETYFMERLWASFLSSPISVEDLDQILLQDTYVHNKKGKYRGIVAIQKKYEPPIPKRKKRGWQRQREPALLQWKAQEKILLKFR